MPAENAPAVSATHRGSGKGNFIVVILLVGIRPPGTHAEYLACEPSEPSRVITPTVPMM